MSSRRPDLWSAGTISHYNISSQDNTTHHQCLIFITSKVKLLDNIAGLSTAYLTVGFCSTYLQPPWLILSLYPERDWNFKDQLMEHRAFCRDCMPFLLIIPINTQLVVSITRTCISRTWRPEGLNMPFLCMFLGLGEFKYLNTNLNI